MRLLKRFHTNESGSVAIIFALAIIAMLLGAGIAIDQLRAAKVRASVQAALDTAVLFGARLDPADLQSQGEAIFYKSLTQSEPQLNPNEIQVQFSPASPIGVTGVANGSLDTTLMKIAGIATLPISRSATAVLSTAGTDPSAAVGCVYFTEPNQPGIRSTGNSTFETDCTVHFTTSNEPINVRGNASVVLGGFCATNDAVVQGAGQLTPAMPTPGCQIVRDPFGNLTSPPEATGGCSSSALIEVANGSQQTLSPGIYCGAVVVRNGGELMLSGGVYTFRDRLTIEQGGELSGEQVLLVLDRNVSEYEFDGTTDLEGLRAGDYRGFVIFHEDYIGSSNTISVGENANFQAEGVLYLPNTNLKLNTVVNDVTTRSLLITDRIELDGNAGFSATVNDTSDTPLPLVLANDTTNGVPRLIE